MNSTFPNKCFYFQFELKLTIGSHPAITELHHALNIKHVLNLLHQ